LQYFGNSGCHYHDYYDNGNQNCRNIASGLENHKKIIVKKHYQFRKALKLTSDDSKWNATTIVPFLKKHWKSSAGLKTFRGNKGVGWIPLIKHIIANTIDVEFIHDLYFMN
jgi:hypothetical protein